MEDQEDRTTRDDGSHPVRDHPPDNPGPGRTGMQYFVIGIGALIILAALLWLLLPFGGR